MTRKQKQNLIYAPFFILASPFLGVGYVLAWCGYALSVRLLK